MSHSPTTASSSNYPDANPVTNAAARSVAAAKAGISIAEFAERLGRLVGEKVARDERERQQSKPGLNL